MTDKPVGLYQDVVAYFGNQETTAKALKVTQPSVSDWVNGKKFMSWKTATRTERTTEGKFKAVELCPALREFATT